MSEELKTRNDQFHAMQEVIDQTVSLFHLLRALAEQIHQQGELSAGRRGILRELDRLGPQTVPQMARARPVSRQHIQLEVNQLEDDGLVELIENIAHKRSRLVRLTQKGKAYLKVMEGREAEFYAQFEPRSCRNTPYHSAGAARIACDIGASTIASHSREYTPDRYDRRRHRRE